MLSMTIVHYPIYDRKGLIQSSSITPFDIHDLSRTATTYGLDRLYLIHPSPLQRSVAERILGFWEYGGGKDWNPCRSLALQIAEVLPSFKFAVDAMVERFGKKPFLVATTAKILPGQISFIDLRNKLDKEHIMLVLGTGWGLTEEVLETCNAILEPIKGPTNFNHLSVRAAGAIMCDRLLGECR